MWPVSGLADWPAGGHIPQPHRAVDAAAGQDLAVRAERHRRHDRAAGGAAGERRADRAAGGHVPQPHRAIVAGGGQELAVRAERHRHDRARVAGEGVADLAAGGQVPQPHRAIACRRLARILPSGLNATDSTRWRRGRSGRSPDRRPVAAIPQPHRAIVAARWPGACRRAERHRADWAGVAGERARRLAAGGHVPQPHRAIGAGAGQDLAVRAERHRRRPRSVEPVRGWPIGRPVATSHSRTVPSALPLARILPSGLNATA